MALKKIKKCLAVFLCAAIAMFSCTAVVFASEDGMLFDLTSLGVLNGYELPNDLHRPITRAEFSKLVANALGYSDLSDNLSEAGYFNDIGANKYRGAVNLLYELNIVSGTGGGTYSPDMNLTFQQAGKILVCVLGYSNIVKNNDFSAYVLLAGSLGVYKNVDTSAPVVSVYDALVMIHNSLDIDVMVKDFGMAGDTYKVEDGKTLKSSLATTSGREIVKYTGVVTADTVTYLYQDRTGMKDNHIEINGKLYKSSFNIQPGLAGMHVNYYLDFSDDAEGIITAIAPSDKNGVKSVDLEDLSSVSSGKIKYFEKNSSKESTVDCDIDAKIVYNGRWNRNAKLSDLLSFKNGYVKFIDNNDDEEYDIVFVYEYSDALVERVYADSQQVYFANNAVIGGKRYIELDRENVDNVKVVLQNADGIDINVEDIKPDDVISIAYSKDQKVVTAVVSDKKVTGVVSYIEDDNITIDSDVYYFVTAPNVKVGDHVDAYINFNNKVAYAEITQTENSYGYVLDIASKSGLSGNVEVSLITPGYISESKKDSFDEEGSSETTKTLYFRNTAHEVYSLADKVSVNGTRINSSDAIALIKNTIVSYDLNSDGKVSKFETLDPFMNNITSKKYNENGKVFSNTVTEGFGIDESKSMSICIPTNLNTATDNDFLVPVKLVHGTSYNINAYDVDEDSKIANLVVIKETMLSGISGSVSYANSEIGVVIKVVSEYDAETGDEKLRVNMLTKDGEKNLYVSSTMDNAIFNKFAKMSKGDLFYYDILEGTEELKNCELVKSEKTYGDGAGLFLENEVNESCLGVVSDLYYTFVSANRNRWADRVSIHYAPGGVKKYEIFKSGGPVIFVMDDQGNAKLGTFDDININDTIFVTASSGTVRAVVIRK